MGIVSKWLQVYSYQINFFSFPFWGDSVQVQLFSYLLHKSKSKENIPLMRLFYLILIVGYYASLVVKN